MGPAGVFVQSLDESADEPATLSLMPRRHISCNEVDATVIFLATQQQNNWRESNIPSSLAELLLPMEYTCTLCILSRYLRLQNIQFFTADFISWTYVNIIRSFYSPINTNTKRYSQRSRCSKVSCSTVALVNPSVVNSPSKLAFIMHRSWNAMYLAGPLGVVVLDTCLGWLAGGILSTAMLCPSDV